MKYQVNVSSKIEKEMSRVPRKDRDSILAEIRALAQEPRPAGCMPVRLAEKGTYRLRVGNYRVVYTANDDKRLVVVARVSRRRGDTYRRLR